MRILAARLDNDGDVLLTGPAVRALAAAGTVDVLASPSGAGAARLLPGVADVLVFDPPWSGFSPAPVDADAVQDLVARVRGGGYDEAVVFTSFHQSPLPLALLLRLAGVRRISATSEDYPGSLLDVRHRREGTQRADVGEAEAALDLAAAAGFGLPAGDDGRLRVLTTAAPPDGLPDSYVVVHPGASVPARAPLPGQAAGIVEALVHAGRDVVVTGGPGERELTAAVAGGRAVDLGGRTDLPGLAAVLAAAEAVVVGNTGPAHLAAAVGTPVVSLFAPVVPAARWAPHGVPHVLLGDQSAPCRGTRARECPVPGHPCLAGVSAREVVAAVDALAPPVPGAVVEEAVRGNAPAGRTS
ncbi:glycosyltransferase family 9 protein [Paenibacillus sp. TRM 82003]|uniref:glycosyltransferase family 9 protein n=1 Tax=Kineococcus sp. TRM81007 TaxID=2925831 RepID=UPI001F5844E0|nr:glycosyltransferase family 9 protein [Kineococcus sp. TRM81007]MCI2240674.1 glycosyltransferase family 9 protein [Kineococcus sp. TRM81007]MCI3925404.1 glycosyltransferase family 9 protein [Paenibacillus sp. TRM 82003]